jgi:radical SAM protein with 4Fe4S-binding SPASM domain|nr:PqqD family peptide modification chaperone [uncultured Acetatifactor sp.]
MNDVKNFTGSYVRPGVLFWKDGNKYFLFDQVSLEQFRINKAAYEILMLCDGKSNFDDIVEYVYTNNMPCDHITVRNDVDSFMTVLENNGYLLRNKDLKKMFKNYVCGSRGDVPKFNPGLMYWEVTNACNRQCIMCYNPSNKLGNDELSLEEGYDLLKQFKEMGGSCVIFTGGEPLLRKDVTKWIEYCTENNIHTEIFTNGTLITRQMAERLKESGLGYCRISIHGSDAETHDFITGVSGTYDLAIQGIKNLVEAGIKVAWSFVANRKNFVQLRMVVEQAINLKCHGIIIGSLDLIGRGSLAKELELDSSQEATLWRFLDESIYVYGNRIRFAWGSDMCKDEAWEYYVMNPVEPKPEWKFDPNRYMRYVKNSLCGVGQRSFAITANGNITPCPALYDVCLGNYRNHPIKSIWNDAPQLKVFREKLLEEFESCGKCGMRYACVGGCRANAFHGCGSLLGRDNRRCKVQASRARAELDTSMSFYSEEELSKEKYIINKEGTEYFLDKLFSNFGSEGTGPWIPYIGTINKIKMNQRNKEKKYD